jgi:tetratricopeptide (TPR) repeat protein
VVFYRQAIAGQLTDDEVKHLARMSQVIVPDSITRAGFAAQARESLARCLLELGKAQEAQKWMLQAAEIREQNDLGRQASLAGEVQRASGARDIERQIKSAERSSANDPKYWQDRALYYHGRNEPAEEEAALRKGLALTKPQLAPARPVKGGADWRSQLLSQYAQFLARVNRANEAVDLLRKELAEAPAGSASSVQAAHRLAFDFQDRVGVDDSVLWAWLAKRPKWDFTEQRLLWRMLESATKASLPAQLSRAEKLALDGDPSRASTLGWIENRMGFAERSLPLLEQAVEKAQDKDSKERAAFSLLESYLDVGDWERAESIFPTAAARLTPDELPVWYSKIAVRAAQAAAKDDALRIWRRVANLDFTATGAVTELADEGLKGELVEFYRQMQSAIPSSDIPTKVLSSLGVQDARKPGQGEGK